MFEQYTEGARRTICFARYEAGQYGSRYIETEHLLIGLLREDKRLARNVLQRPGAAESIRKEIDAQVVHRERISTSVEIPLSAESRYILRFASASAKKLGHQNVDNVHLLLGILRKEGSVAARILRSYCVGSDTIEQIIENHADREPSNIAPAPGVPMSNSASIELQLTIEKLLEAWRIRDAEKVSEFFADDGQFWNAQGELSTGSGVKAAIGAYFAASESEVWSTEVKDVLRLTGGVAAVTLSWSDASALEGRATKRFHVTIAMREDAEGWYVVSAHPFELKVK